MINWVAQGLTKVLPQPDDKYKETNNKDEEEHTEVRQEDLIMSLSQCSCKIQHLIIQIKFNNPQNNTAYISFTTK